MCTYTKRKSLHYKQNTYIFIDISTFTLIAHCCHWFIKTLEKDGRVFLIEIILTSSYVCSVFIWLISGLDNQGVALQVWNCSAGETFLWPHECFHTDYAIVKVYLYSNSLSTEII